MEKLTSETNMVCLFNVKVKSTIKMKNVAKSKFNDFKLKYASIHVSLSKKFHC